LRALSHPVGMADSNNTPKNSALGDVLRKIVDERGLRQKVLAAKVGITEASLSNIVNGKARPRQLTLTRLIDQLQVTPEELQRILAAYDHAERIELPERPASPEQPISQDELERVKRYMEIKSMSVTFQDDVEKELDRTGLFFERAHRQENIICDFLLPGTPRIAVDCKYNLNRDWDRTVASVKLRALHVVTKVAAIAVTAATIAATVRLMNHRIPVAVALVAVVALEPAIDPRSAGLSQVPLYTTLPLKFSP
jgi:transcriptional regulator with XRE-family HTH domain